MSTRTPLIVRPCFEMDLQLVQLIYAHHVTTGTGTFETEPPSLEEMRTRWSAIAARGWPYLVACAANDLSRVHGFAYGVQFRDRAAYSWAFEDSVYVAPHAQGRGIGAALLSALIGELEVLGATQLIAVIGDSGNAASIALHQKLQFRQVGVLSDVGYKFGRWLDVVLMQRPLQKSATAK
jgi:L-amino acid N-acyltransferase YncA